MAALPADDRDLDDDALWAVIDSAAAATAASYSSPATTISRYRKPLTPTTNTSKFLSPSPKFLSPPPPPQYHHRNNYSNSPITDDFRRPAKILRSSSSCISELSHTSPHSAAAVNRWPINPVYQVKELSPYVQENVSPTIVDRRVDDNKENFTHCLSGRYPTVSLFKDYQKAAMEVLEKSDYTMISGNPYIKKSGWRKIAFYFNVSFEIKDKTIEFDDNRNVQRAEFLIRASMHGRFSDGWGSCERREKKFMKPNNDIPSTAETRAKNKACQDLIGIGSSWCKP
ncbi:uncharacterized protein LOC141592220 isoform X2 [Silene latifolia]|uniref:uncharacterized protein LOC141592220 isoform X2 n=1 Tax=Silene latifolia TaxID=37657 RepID=UPI003D7849BE